MCGIAGLFNIAATKKIEIEHLEEMISVIRHRGPDQLGCYLDNSIGLAHSRLSIIGLEDGVQPIHNEDQSIWIIFNGEIYNYPELRSDLIKKGHRFYTSTDTEVLIHLYEDKGISFLNELNGQFAFAIWDTKKKELFLARDRLGIRPLHYTTSKGQFLFASEIKSIFTQKSVARNIDSATLNDILTFWTPIGGNTFFQDIKELQPGHFLKISTTKQTLNKYWELPFVQNEDKLNWSIDRISEEINSILLDSIKLRLRADVSVGAYLSGGLDSSAIAATVKQGLNNSLKTFGIRFSNSEYDEGNFQKIFVDRFLTEHHEVMSNSENISKHFSDILWHAEKPMLRTAPVPLYLLSKLVKKNNIKVVLTGEGADEIFGGYNIFREAKVRWFWSRNKASNLRPMLLARLYPYILKDERLKEINKSFFGQGLEDSDSNYFSHQIRWDNTSKIKRFLSKDFVYLKEDYDSNYFNTSLPNDFDQRDYFEKAQYFEVNTLLSNYLLSSQGDRVAMANSIEIRFPFLDHRLIEFMAKIPSRLKIYGMNEKFLLKRSFKEKLPKSIVLRSKNPYRAPIKQSLLSKSNSENLERYCSPESLKKTGIFDPKYTTKLFKKNSKSSSGSSEWESMAICGIYSTQIICDKFISNFEYSKETNIKFDLIVDNRSK